MMAASAKEKFDAAVKVIRGLPANGPFQPSYELMLKFYSYYKQATEGKCNLPKPSFWDVVNKKKWEAWNKLGNMEKEKAMTLYVDELKKVSNHVKETYYPQPQIVETMPQTEEVSMFLQKLDTFYEMVEEAPVKENNNVKATDPSVPNGDIKAICNDISQDNEDLNYSDNVTQLLKQDMKKAQESSGILVPEDSRTNGHGHHNGSYSNGVHHFNGNGEQGESDDEEDDDGDDEDDDDDDDGETDENEEGVEEEFVRVESNQVVSSSPNKASPVKKDGGSGRRVNGVTEWSESETENEEFCDTSDEPVNPDIPLTPQSNHISMSSPNASSPTHSNIPLNSSTPIPQPKSVRINGVIPQSQPLSSSASTHTAYNHQHHLLHRHNRILSDSLEVNASGIVAEHQDELSAVKTGSGSSPNISLFSSSVASLSQSSGDTSYADGGRKVEGLAEAEVNCRGGDEEEGRERRKKGGGQSSRGGSSREGLRRGTGGSGSGSGGSEGGARPPNPNRGGAGGSRDPPSGMEEGRNDLNEQIVVTLLRLQRDMSGVLNRLHSLEALVKEGRREKEERKQMANKSTWWWPFPDLTFKSAALIFLWPIVLQVLLTYISRRRSRRLRK